MKRIPAVFVAVVALAFAATVALAADTTAPAPAPAKSTTPTHHSSSSKSSSSKTTHPKTDLNTASKEDLMKLPGVDDAIADKIVAARPFKSRSELESKNIVTKEQYSKLSAHVTVEPPAKTASK
jgi:DNA uptake protein ComE-like DNA-binding protein